MWLGYIITIIYLLLVSINFKKGVILIGTTIQLLSYLGTGIEGVKIYTLLTLGVSFLFLIKYMFISRINQQDSYPWWILVSSVFMSVCYLISEYYADNKHIPIVIVNIITSFIFPYILWNVIDSKATLNYCVKCLACMMLVAVMVAVPEQILRRNEFTAFVSNQFLIEDFVIDADVTRFGLKRTNSIFAYFSVCGTVCSLAFCLFFYIKYKYVKLFRKYWIRVNILCVTLPFCAFATGSRAVILGLFAIIISVLLTKRFLKSKSFVWTLCFLIVFSPFIISALFAVTNSMINSNEHQFGDGSGGSTMDLRETQLNISLLYFLDSPLWGNGRMYIWEQVAPDNPMLLGAESIWFSLLVDYGIMGCIAFLFLLVGIGIELYRKNKLLVCLPIAYLLITSFSPDAGIQYNIILTFALILLKCEKYYTNNLSKTSEE